MVELDTNLVWRRTYFGLLIILLLIYLRKIQAVMSWAQRLIVSATVEGLIPDVPDELIRFYSTTHHAAF